MAKANKGNTGRDWWPNQVHLFELHCATWFLPSCMVCPLHRDPPILSFVRIWGADSSQPYDNQKTLPLLIGFLRPPQQIILFLRCLEMTSISHVLWTSVSVAFHVLYTRDLSAHKPELTGRSLQLSNKWQTQSVRQSLEQHAGQSWPYKKLRERYRRIFSALVSNVSAEWWEGIL